MKRFDFHNARMERLDSAPEGVDTSEAYMTEALGAQHLSGSVYEIGPGLRGFPYHWEAAKEEWLLVIEGAPTVRTPEGETQLRAGDLVAFPTGPTGAHQILNRTRERVRLLLFSNQADPNVIVYPDSRKVGIRGSLDLPGSANYSLDASLGYWENES